MKTEFTFEGLAFLVDIESDQDHSAPWEEEDGHGPVSDWTTRDKRPGEMVLNQTRGAKRFYDFAAAVKQAKAEGWNAAPYYPPGEETKGQRAHKAATADFDRLKAWCDDRWQYVGVIVTCTDLPGQPSASLWGIESDAGDYLDEVAEELAAEIVAQAADEVKRACA